MRSVKFSPQKIYNLFYHHKVLTKNEILTVFGCSTMTLWRILKSHGYYTSYNCNASYYTLLDIPVFDQDGLWSYRGIRFSTYGSLTETVKELVYKSKSGLRASDLHDKVGVTVMPTLIKLNRLHHITREKFERCYVYFHSDAQQRHKQINNWQSQHEKVLERKMLAEPELIIAVLVELIKRPQLTPQQITHRLSREGYRITRQVVESLFSHYNLPQKKT